MPISLIAARLGVSERTVHLDLTRAIQKLRQHCTADQKEAA